MPLRAYSCSALKSVLPTSLSVGDDGLLLSYLRDCLSSSYVKQGYVYLPYIKDKYCMLIYLFSHCQTGFSVIQPKIFFLSLILLLLVKSLFTTLNNSSPALDLHWVFTDSYHTSSPQPPSQLWYDAHISPFKF